MDRLRNASTRAARAFETSSPSGGMLLLVWTMLMTLVVLAAGRYALPPSVPDPAMDWTRFGYDAAGSRTNPAEQSITAATVSGLHRLWRAQLPAVADSSPAFLRALRFPDGRTRDVLYLTTRMGDLVALDADTGARLWAKTAPPFDSNKVTTASPFADSAQQVVYAYRLDGKVHRYDAVTGQELTGHGWPVTVTTMKESEKVSSALNAANGYLYIATASFGGDAPPYQGHVVAVNLATGAQHVFNAICSNVTRMLQPGQCRESGAGIWARPGVVVDPTTGNVFVTTGNGPYTGRPDGTAWGESVLELTRDGSRLLDSYTPAQPASLSLQDQDLGSAAPALLPTIPGSRTPYLAVQTSKTSVLQLLNRRDLSGKGGPGHIGGEIQTLDAPGHCPVLTQPAVWTDPQDGAIWVFVTNYCAISGYRVVTSPRGVTSLRQAWSVNTGASSPLVAGGVLFAARTDPQNTAVLALDPRTGRQLWSSAERAAGGSIGAIHWESPIVVGGRLYCTDEDGALTAYGL